MRFRDVNDDPERGLRSHKDRYMSDEEYEQFILNATPNEEDTLHYDGGIEDIGPVEELEDDENKPKPSWDLSNWGMTKEEFNQKTKIESKENEGKTEDREIEER